MLEGILVLALVGLFIYFVMELQTHEAVKQSMQSQINILNIKATRLEKLVKKKNAYIKSLEHELLANASPSTVADMLTRLFSDENSLPDYPVSDNGPADETGNHVPAFGELDRDID